MKKFFVYAIAMVSMAMISSCGNKTAAGENGADSAAADSTVTEEANANPGVFDTKFFTLTLPEGWELNGEPNEYKVDVRTTETIPTYYSTVQFEDYRHDIAEWKRLDIGKDMQPDGTIDVNGREFTVMSLKGDAFYDIYVVSIVDDKGALCAHFSGDAKKDLQEQKDLLKQLLQAVVLK